MKMRARAAKMMYPAKNTHDKAGKQNQVDKTLQITKVGACWTRYTNPFFNEHKTSQL